MLGVPEGKIERFSNLKQKVIQPAIAEINSDLTRLRLTATYHKIGRTVAEVEIAWEEKEDLTKVSAEHGRSKVGRAARLASTAETVVRSFPASGSVKYTDWEAIAKAHCNWDLSKIADAFRSFCQGRNIKLDAKSIETIFTDFCKKQTKV